MTWVRFILLFPLTAILVGCHPLEPSVDTGCCPVEGLPPDQMAATWCAPPTVHQGPVYLEPGVVAPAQPSVILPPVAVQPVGPPPPVQTGPGWFDVLPAEGGAISPDFGLPAAPVITNRVPNPLLIPVTNQELAWDQLADVVSDYFPIMREQPVHTDASVMTAGYIETPFQTGSTILEPQRNDSVGSFNRWESTLQSIRRKAVINVEPSPGGYAVRVNVIKQLEDLPQPEGSLSGPAVLRNDGALPTSRRAVLDQSRPSPFWIDLGRDEPLEQEMLRRIQERLAGPPPQSPRAIF